MALMLCSDHGSEPSSHCKGGTRGAERFCCIYKSGSKESGSKREDRFPWPWVIFTSGFKRISLCFPLSFPPGRGGPCAEGLVSVEPKSIKLCWEEQGTAHSSRLSACSKQHPNDIFQIFLFLDMVEKAKISYSALIVVLWC